MLRYRGRVKVVETTGRWGAYAGERILLGDGLNLEDDLGVLLRKAFQPGAAEALEQGEPLGEAFELAEVVIEVRIPGESRRT